MPLEDLGRGDLGRDIGRGGGILRRSRRERGAAGLRAPRSVKGTGSMLASPAVSGTTKKAKARTSGRPDSILNEKNLYKIQENTYLKRMLSAPAKLTASPACR